MSNSLPSGQGDYGFKWNPGQAVQPGSLKKSGKIMLAKTTTLSQFSWLCQFFPFLGEANKMNYLAAEVQNLKWIWILEIWRDSLFNSESQGYNGIH